MLPKTRPRPSGVQSKLSSSVPSQRVAWRTPPRQYGPWELVTSLLTEALVARGVDVTLFATLDSETAGTLAGVVPASYSEDPSIDAKVWEALHVAHVFERAAEFDRIFFDLARQENVPAYPFLLEGVALDRRYNQADGIHPNAAGARIIAQGLAPVVAFELASV